MKRKGFTLTEVVLSLIVFSIILLIFATLASFSLDFTNLSLDTDEVVQRYAMNNTFIYKKIRENEILEVKENQVFLTDGVFTIKQNKLFYNSEPMYDLYDNSYIKFEDNVFEMHLNIDNGLDQEVTIIVNKR